MLGGWGSGGGVGGGGCGGGVGWGGGEDDKQERNNRRRLRLLQEVKWNILRKDFQLGIVPAEYFLS